MRIFSCRRSESRARARCEAVRSPANLEFAVGVLLLLIGALVLLPLAVRAQDSVLTDDQLESLDSQFEDKTLTIDLGDPDVDVADDEEDTLWDEYQQYHDGGDIRTSGERVKIGDEVVVREDEHIRGDVVSVGGRVTVYGYVEGDVVSIGGDVVLHDGAEVDGDVVSVGGRVRDVGSARVHGEKVSVNIPLPMNWNWWSFDDDDLHIGLSNSASFGFKLGLLLVGLLLALLANAVAGHRIDVMSRRVEAEPGQSFLVGMLGAFGTPLALVIASILLAITFIGLLLIPVLLVFVWVMSFGGLVAVILAVGRRLSQGREQPLRATRSPYYYVLIGFLGLNAFGILGSLFEIGGGFLVTLSILCGVLNAFVLLFASTLGYGALLLSRFGTQLPSNADMAFAGGSMEAPAGIDGGVTIDVTIDGEAVTPPPPPPPAPEMPDPPSEGDSGGNEPPKGESGG